MQGLTGRSVSANDVVVEDAFEIPAFLLSELGEVSAADQALLLACNGDEDQRRGKMMLAEDAGGFKADSGAAGIVVGSRRVELGFITSVARES